MCCFLSTLLFFGPRLAFLVYWLSSSGWLKTIQIFHSFLWPLLGWIFLPWTTLAYVIVFPVVGFDWIWLLLAFLLDITAYSSGYRHRRAVRRAYRR
jgi:hypothetical protein